MRLITINYPSCTRAGVIDKDDVLDISAGLDYFGLETWVPESVVSVLQAGDAGMDRIRRLVEVFKSADYGALDDLRFRKILSPLASLNILSPIPRPNWILLGGRTFRAHVEEMSVKFNVDVNTLIPEFPHGFPKDPNTVIGHKESIKLPENHPNMVDYEGELAIVIGKTCHNVTEDNAMDYVAGYTLLNDVSARDWNATMRKEDGSLDFTYIRLGKQFPTFCPVGPCLITKDELPDHNDIEFALSLNGEEMQRANTNDLLHPIPKVVSHFSKWHKFEPGDILTIGSPSGVGYSRNPPVFLTHGDVVEISIPSLGVVLSNPITE